MTTATLPDSTALNFEVPYEATELSAEDFSSFAASIVNEARATNGPARSGELFKPQELMYWKVRENPTHEGWKRRAGWIIIGPGTGSVGAAEEMLRFSTVKEVDPLYQFGSYEGGGGTKNRNPLMVDGPSRQHPWGVWTELFQKPGGLALMPKSQLISLGFHRKPEIRRARPDLADVADISCDICPEGTSVYTARQHLSQHMAIAHKGERHAELAARINADAIAAIAGKQAPGLDPQAIATIVAATIAAIQGTSAPAAPEPEPEPDPNSRPQLLKYIAKFGLDTGGKQPFQLTKDEAASIVNAHRAQSLTADPE